MQASERIQLLLPIPYGRELRDDARVRAHLDRGFRIAQLQRTSDHEAIVTLVRDPRAAAGAGGDGS